MTESANVGPCPVGPKCKCARGSPYDVARTSYRDAAGSELSAVAGGRVRIPQDFARSLYPLLVPGTTLLLTDAPVLEENSGAKLTVLSSGNPN